MFTVTATFDLTLLYFVAVNVVCILSYVLILRHRARAIRRDAALVSKTIVDYFLEGGNNVAVECTAKHGGERFIALIRSRPSRRFRNSHIVELALAAHVRKVTGLDVDKVYWSFEAKTRQEASPRDASTGDEGATMKGDDYFDEELSTLTKPPGYRVRELSREKFDALVSKQGLAPNPQVPTAAIA